MKPTIKRRLVKHITAGYKISTHRACQLAQLANSSCYYKSYARDQTDLTMRLKELVGVRVRYGYRGLHVLLQREGWQVNDKRVYRIYARRAFIEGRRCRSLSLNCHCC